MKCRKQDSPEQTRIYFTYKTLSIGSNLEMSERLRGEADSTSPEKRTL